MTRATPGGSIGDGSECTDTTSPPTSTEPSDPSGLGPATVEAIKFAAAVRSRLSVSTPARLPAEVELAARTDPDVDQAQPRRPVGWRSVGMHGPIEPR